MEQLDSVARSTLQGNLHLNYICKSFISDKYEISFMKVFGVFGVHQKCFIEAITNISLHLQAFILPLIVIRFL